MARGHGDRSGDGDGMSARRRRRHRPDVKPDKVEQASLESMDCSDPPSYLPVRSGAPPQRRTQRATVAQALSESGASRRSNSAPSAT